MVYLAEKTVELYPGRLYFGSVAFLFTGISELPSKTKTAIAVHPELEIEKQLAASDGPISLTESNL